MFASQQKLLQLRDYNEHDVINVFALSGYAADTTTVVLRGLPVSIAGNGWQMTTLNPVEFLGNPSAFSPTNVVSQRYGAIPKVVPATAGQSIIGLTLFDIRETDENGELLKFHPRKAAELEACISGQAVPIVRKGLFAISGLQVEVTGVSGVFNGYTSGTVTAGSLLYVGSGALSSYASGNSVGVAVGSTDANGATIIYFGAGV